MLRWALEEINKVSTEQGLSMLDGACKVDKLACEALETTPSEAAERVKKLVEALEDCRNLISKTEFPTVAEQADKAISEWRRDKCSS